MNPIQVFLEDEDAEPLVHLQMIAVPSVGDEVDIDEARYLVRSRRWVVDHFPGNGAVWNVHIVLEEIKV